MFVTFRKRYNYTNIKELNKLEENVIIGEIIGIDLSTKNSSVAVMEASCKAKVKENAENDRTTPPIVHKFLSYSLYCTSIKNLRLQNERINQDWS